MFLQNVNLSGHLDVVDALSATVEVSKKYQRRRRMSALHWAAECGQIACVRLLLARSFDPDSSTSEPYLRGVFEANGGVTPIMLASAKGHRQIVAALTERGASVDKVDDGGESRRRHLASPLTSVFDSHTFCIHSINFYDNRRKMKA